MAGEQRHCASIHCRHCCGWCSVPHCSVTDIHPCGCFCCCSEQLWICGTILPAGFFSGNLRKSYSIAVRCKATLTFQAIVVLQCFSHWNSIGLTGIPRTVSPHQPPFGHCTSCIYCLFKLRVDGQQAALLCTDRA